LAEQPDSPGGSAVFSPCGRYRYRLERRLGAGPAIAVIMVNPSAADADRNDPTIRRVAGFAQREGWGCFTVVNLFGLIASSITMLAQVEDAAGPDNADHLARAIVEADRCVVAWGRLTKLPMHLRGAWQEVDRLARSAGKPLHCWGITQAGDPRHPLFLPRDTALKCWQSPAESAR